MSNERKFWKRWSFATNCLGRHFVQIALFVRMRSLDECRVAVRSRKVDFLSVNERYCVVELMRVARYCVYVSTIACFKFATFCLKSATWRISDFNPYAIRSSKKSGRKSMSPSHTYFTQTPHLSFVWNNLLTGTTHNLQLTTHNPNNTPRFTKIRQK